MSSHDRGHTERVRTLAVYIAREEEADVEVVEKAAELHDIARGEPNHARRGAEIARKVLQNQGYSTDFIAKVAHCIEAHSFSSGVAPQTLEAKILSDADKLDAIGAIGVARAFMFSGETGRTIEKTLRHFEEKLLTLKELFYTQTACQLAVTKDHFMREFYRQLTQELNYRLRVQPTTSVKLSRQPDDEHPPL